MHLDDTGGTRGDQAWGDQAWEDQAQALGMHEGAVSNCRSRHGTVGRAPVRQSCLLMVVFMHLDVLMCAGARLC